MISSKYVNHIAIFLVVFALIGVICFMFFSSDSNNEVYAPRIYSDKHTLTYTEQDFYSSDVTGGAVKINLNRTSASSKSRNVVIDDTTVTVNGGGNYVLSGTLENGCIIVNSEDSAPVRLILSGVDITNTKGAAIYVKQSKKTYISLVEGTVNTLTDSEKRNDENINAALYSADDLTINGKGSLTVNGNYKDGIKCNDTLKITEASVTVTSVDDGINANDATGILRSTVKVESDGDGIKCENTEDEDKGFIAIEEATLEISSQNDGVYSSDNMYLIDTKANITSGGGFTEITANENFGGRFGGFDRYKQTENTTPSAKGIKTDANLMVDGGTYVLSCSDDGLHANGNVDIKDSSITIETENDGIHADVRLNLSPEKIVISNSLEGLEGGYITIDGGNIHVISSDDGINATGKNPGGFKGPMGMHAESVSDKDVYLFVNKGTLLVECSGDGLDANGAIMINGGDINVYGPENNGNGSLDFEYGLVIKGGSLLAAGSSGMGESPHKTSSQNSMVFYLDENYANGSEIMITDTNGNEIISGKSTKSFDWICVSTESIKQNQSYRLLINKEEKATLEVTDTVTSYGNKRWGMMR